MQDNIRCIDVLELYRIDKEGEWHKEIETNNHPSLWQRFLKFLGLYKCAGDAFTDYMVNQLAVFTAGKAIYTGVGTSASSPTDYSLNDLVAPVMTRVAPLAITYTNVYGTNAELPDTTVYTITLTSSGDYTLREAALYTAFTSGYMCSRQTFPDWAVANGEMFAMVWKITYGRG